MRAEPNEVERVCAYIKDDGVVASYFGIPRDRVEAARKRLAKRPTRVGNEGRKPPETPTGLGMPTKADRATAAADSHRFAAALDTYWRNQARATREPVEWCMARDLYGYDEARRWAANHGGKANGQ